MARLSSPWQVPEDGPLVLSGDGVPLGGPSARDWEVPAAGVASFHFSWPLASSLHGLLDPIP